MTGGVSGVAVGVSAGVPGGMVIVAGGAELGAGAGILTVDAGVGVAWRRGRAGGGAYGTAGRDGTGAALAGASWITRFS